MGRKAAAFLFIAAAAFTLTAAEQKTALEMTIDSAIKLALKNNTDYLISKETVNQYRHKLRQNLGFLPNVTLEGSKNLDEKLMELEMPPFFPGDTPQKVTIDFTKAYEFTLQVVQPVFTGGKVLYSFKNAKLDLEIAREKQADAGREVTLAVKKVFFNILVMKELLKAHQEALELAETNYRNIKERFDLGMASKYDLLRAELAAASVKPSLLKVKKQLALSRLNLKLMTGIAENRPVRITGRLNYTRHQLDHAALVRQTLVNASEIQQLKMQMKKADNLLKIAYGQFMPALSLVAAYSYRSDAFNFRGKTWENFYTINLGIRFPLFTGFKRSAQVGEIKTMKKILDLNYKKLNEALILRIKNLYMTLEEEYENIQTGLKNIEAAQEGVRIARLNYDEGLISILELNTSINESTKATVNFLQAVYNYNIAVAEIEKISGIKINGGNR